MSKAVANPFRKGSYNHKVMEALLKSKKALPVDQVAKLAKLPIARTAQVLSALRNPMHNSRARRAGLTVDLANGEFLARRVEPDPKARRPAQKKPK